VEDIAAELIFCSSACLESDRSKLDRSQAPDHQLIECLRRPIRSGWSLWLRNAGPLSLKVGLPLGVAYSLLRFAALGPGVGQGEQFSGPHELGMLFCCSLGAAAVAVTLSQAHTGSPVSNPWRSALARYLPWVGTWLVFAVAVLLGSLLLIVPGIIAGIRLFWADEFALIHRLGPIAALRESHRLTRGLTGRIFGFQFVLGLAQYLALIPLVFGFLAVGLILDALEPGLPSTLVMGTFLSTLLVNFYASIHAPEVVYFYGLRALRAQIPEEAVQGDWVARALGGG
jgi:hypothetical protein